MDRVLTAAYLSRDIKSILFVFRKEEGIKVINGIVKTGRIPKGQTQLEHQAPPRTSASA